MKQLGALTLALLALVGCSTQHRFDGAWQTTDHHNGIEFDPNGTGTAYRMHQDGLDKTSFTYEVRDANTAVVHAPLGALAVLKITGNMLRDDTDNETYTRVDKLRLVRPTPVPLIRP